MKPTLALVVSLSVLWVGAAGAQQPAAPATPPLRSTPVLTQALTGDPSLAGKSMTASQLELAPGAVLTNPHSHPGELFGYILEGAVLTGLNGAPPQRYDQGQMFYEYRGVTHTHFENVSQTQPARVLVILIGDTDPS